MNIHGDKSQKNTSEGSAHSAAKKQVSSNPKGNLVDNRPSSVAQKMQMKSMVQDESSVQLKANNTGLPDQLKSGIENLSGHSMDDVKVHYNSAQPAQLNAHAYAQGTNIHIASGQEKHLPHEAWHVVQQKQGRVKPTMQLKGKVNVNNDKGLEKEADVMGIQAMAQRQVMPSSLIKVPDSNGILQRVWREDGRGGHIWDQLMDGVTWHSDAGGMMWYTITNESKITEGSPEHYVAEEGEAHKRSWVDWNTTSIRPAKEFTDDSELLKSKGSGVEEDSDWPQWQKYMQITIAGAHEADSAANVHKTPGFDASTVARLSGSKGAQALLQSHVNQFRIIPRQVVNLRLWQMAEKLAKLGNYTCIVSEPGKSNFWITARVLKRVEHLGGRAPRRIISVPTKEKGLLDGLSKGTLNLDLKKAGAIVFLDDGSFSGAQLVKLINKVVGKGPAHVGLVAVSHQANETLGSSTNMRYIDQPIGMGKDDRAEDLNKVQTMTGHIIHGLDPEAPHPDGGHLAGFYYKIADYASVRTSLLTGTKDASNRTAISGYAQERLMPVRTVGSSAVSMQTVPGTEPYKAVVHSTNPEAFGLEASVKASGGGSMSMMHAGPSLGLGGGRGRMMMGMGEGIGEASFAPRLFPRSTGGSGGHRLLTGKSLAEKKEMKTSAKKETEDESKKEGDSTGE